MNLKQTGKWKFYTFIVTITFVSIIIYVNIQFNIDINLIFVFQ